MDKMTYLLFRQEAYEAETQQWSPLERKFPRIAAKLVQLWKSPTCDDYLRELLLDDRCNRNGFPPEVVDDLILLDCIRWKDWDALGRSGIAKQALSYKFGGSSTPTQQNSRPNGAKSWIKRTFGA